MLSEVMRFSIFARNYFPTYCELKRGQLIVGFFSIPKIQEKHECSRIFVFDPPTQLDTPQCLIDKMELILPFLECLDPASAQYGSISKVLLLAYETHGKERVNELIRFVDHALALEEAKESYIEAASGSGWIDPSLPDMFITDVIPPPWADIAAYIKGDGSTEIALEKLRVAFDQTVESFKDIFRSYH